MDSWGLLASQFSPVGKLQVKVKDRVSEKQGGWLPGNRVTSGSHIHLNVHHYTHKRVHIYERNQCYSVHSSCVLSTSDAHFPVSKHRY